MPKLSQEVAAARRDTILDAARRCFAEYGINVSVDQICAAAGISKGAFYGYFKSKDAAIEAMAADHSQAIQQLAGITDLRTLTDRLFAYAHGGNSASSRLELEAWTHSLTQPALNRVLQNNMRHMRAALAGAITIIGPRAEMLAAILQIFSTGVIVTSALGNDEAEIDLKAAWDELVTALVGDIP